MLPTSKFDQQPSVADSSSEKIKFTKFGVVISRKPSSLRLITDDVFVHFKINSI